MNTLVHHGRPAGASVRVRLQHLGAAALRPTVRMPSAADFLVLATRVAIGVAMLGLAWYGASGELTLRAQAPWLVLAIAGTAVAVASQVAWVLRLRRAVRARIAGVSRRLPIVGSPISIGTGGRLVSVRDAATRLYHRADCALVAGRPATPATVEEHRRQRRIPCEVCEP